MKRRTLILSASIATAFLFLLPMSGRAAPIEWDLTGGGTVTINNAIFSTNDNSSTGSGVIQSFVRIQGNTDVVEGYNTDGRPLLYNENNSPTFTRSLSLSIVPIVTINGLDYREFFLDINQNAGPPSSWLSIDEIRVYLAGSGSITNAINTFPTPLYSLDVLNLPDPPTVDNFLKLDYDLNSGSGSGDLWMYILDSAFTGGDFVYLYTKFGVNFANNDGFEEWAVREAETPIPEPVSMLLFGTGLVGVGGYIRKRFKK